MKWATGTQDDLALGPQFARKFDLTLRFEQIFLTTLPAVLLILVSILYLRYYYRQPVRILSGRILWLKFTAIGALVVVEGIALGFWCSSSILRNSTSIAAALMTFLAAACTAVVLNVEHRRALQSSALTGVYLLVAVLFDIAKIRSYLCRTNMQAFAGLTIASAALKCILLALLEIPKKKYIADAELKKTIGPETLSGFWNRSFFVWLNRTLLFGFRNIITVADLEPLGPEFSSKKLSEKLESQWAKMKTTRYCLAKACFITFYTDFVSVVPPRLCFTGFVFTQPLFLRRAVEYVGDSDESASIRAGLIAASALIFIGVATSRANYSHMNYRMAALLRGAIIPLIFKKTMLLPHVTASESAATTLMSTDVEGIVNGVPKIHEIWAGIVEIGLGLYLLTTVIDQAAFLVVVPVTASAAAAFGLAKLMGPAWAAWNKVIEERVSQTSRALSLAKSIKMVGLQASVSGRLQKLRLKEIASFKTVRRLAILTTVTAVTAYTFTPIIAIAGGLFWTSFDGTLTAVNAFTTVTVVLMVTKPLLDIIYAYGYFKTTLSCFGRIEAYLQLEELAHHLTTAGGSMSTSEEKAAKVPDGAETGAVIEFIGAYIAPAGKTEAKLKNVSFTLERSQVTVVTGSVGAGKTLLLQAMLREAAVVEGHLRHENYTVAYCGQKPWLRNQSVRQCVIGNSLFEETFYQAVIEACQLSEDIKQLPGGKGDDTLVGSSGASLSGGQKHRLALARAIYSRSQLLLLDNPLSGLDASMAHAIYSSLLGAGGILRKSATTVVLATHSAILLKEADRALIIDDGGNISVHLAPEKLSVATAEEDSTTKSDPCTQKEVRPSPAGSAASSLGRAEDLEADDVRSRGGFGLHIFFLKSTRTWMLVVWTVALVLQVATERFPEVFLRIWLETDAGNNRYFIGYALIGTSSFFVSGFAFGFFYLKLVPDSAAQLHKLLLDSVMGATLTFLTSTDTGSIINRFSQDMTILTQNLPKALLETVYLATYAVFDLAIIFSAAKYSAILLPFLAVALYFIQKYYLRTSRQMRHLDIEAKTPLYSLFGDISSGLEHIRAYGWQSDLYDESLRALDYSQKPFYYMFTIQRWLELAMDCTTLVLAVTLVATTTFYKETTTQAALGLSMLNLVTFSTLLNMVIGAWITMETALGAIARLRSFISRTPVEECRSIVSLPQNWPNAGNVEFVNVTAKYNETDSLQTLSEATFSINPGQKVGITGRSGSGKTSLLLTLLNFVDYTGTIQVDGIDISTISRLELRSHVTSLSQDAIVLDGTVRENLLPYTSQLDDAQIDDDLILKILAGVCLAEVVKNKGGLDVQLADLSLSEGQRQLLCLSRAMLHNHWSRSKLVLLDEPTSSLDHETDERIQAFMRETFKDCTVLVVTHRANTLWDADVRLEVENGTVSKHATEP